MQYPGYLLNPGDMFQVDPERVMFATGAPKASTKAVISNTEGEDTDGAEATPAPAPEPEVEEEEEVDENKSPREVLKDLQSQAKNIIASQRTKIGAKRKQDLRAFTKAVKRLLSRSSTSTILTDSMEAQFAELKNQLKIQRQKQAEGKTSLPSEKNAKDVETEKRPDKPLAEAQLDVEKKADEKTESKEDGESTYLSDVELLELQKAFQESVDNPIDSKKPYATPWTPRDYMSAFTFIPRYLEVNQNICSAVYLRHPVARPGIAEVPSPFGIETNGSAYIWYLRRR